MDSSTFQRWRRTSDLVVVLAFLAALVAPSVDRLVRPSRRGSVFVEFRAPARWPGLPRDRARLAAFPAAFTRWFDDHYGLRDRLIHWNSYARWFGLGSSPSPKVVRGSDGWIFVEEGDALESHRGARPMNAATLDAWRRMLEQRRDWLASLGIEYLFVATPSKLDVYPEHIPARYERVGPPRVRQLVEHLAARSDLPVLDLLPVALAAKAQDVEGDYAYYPLGDHWTDRTAYAAYVAIVQRLRRAFPELDPLEPEAFFVEDSDQPGDSWAGRMYLAAELRQASRQWHLRTPLAAIVEGRAGDVRFVAGRRDREGPRAFLQHDSFGIPLRPWLAEHFSRLEATWADHLEPARVLRERPDLVIECFNEFTLLRTTPHSTPEEDGGRRALRFDAAREVVWRMDPAARAWRMRASSGRHPREGARGLVFEPAAEETLELPELDYPPGADLLARFELECDAPGSLTLLYRTSSGRALDRSRRLALPFEAGRQVLYFEISSDPLVGRLALLVERPARRVELVDVELRAARVE